MTWRKIDPKDGKVRYLRKDGDNVILTRRKKGILLSKEPDGFKVDIVDGRLKLRGK